MANTVGFRERTCERLRTGVVHRPHLWWMYPDAYFDEGFYCPGLEVLTPEQVSKYL